MRPPLAIACAALALSVVPSSARAGEGCNTFDLATHIFETSDRDGSGSLSREEFEAAGLARYGMPFEAYDANGDGQASLEEYLDLFDRYHPAHPAHPADDAGGIES